MMNGFSKIEIEKYEAEEESMNKFWQVFKALLAANAKSLQYPGKKRRQGSHKKAIKVKGVK